MCDTGAGRGGARNRLAKMPPLLRGGFSRTECDRETGAAAGNFAVLLRRNEGRDDMKSLVDGSLAETLLGCVSGVRTGACKKQHTNLPIFGDSILCEETVLEPERGVYAVLLDEPWDLFTVTSSTMPRRP